MVGFRIEPLTALGIRALRQAINEEPQALSNLPYAQCKEFEKLWNRKVLRDPFAYQWTLNRFSSIGLQYYTSKRINQEPAISFIKDFNAEILEMVKSVHDTMMQNRARADVDYRIEVYL